MKSKIEPLKLNLNKQINGSWSFSLSLRLEAAVETNSSEAIDFITFVGKFNYESEFQIKQLVSHLLQREICKFMCRKSSGLPSFPSQILTAR